MSICLGRLIHISCLAVFLLVFLSGAVTFAWCEGLWFDLEVSPSTVYVGAGRSAFLNYTVASTGEGSGTVNVSAVGVPDGLDVAVSPASGEPPFNGTVTVTASPSACGDYTFTLEASNGSVSDSETVFVHVSTFDFAPVISTVRVGAGRMAVFGFSVTSVAYPHPYNVSITAVDVPEGFTVTVSPDSGTPDFYGTVTVAVPASAFGDYYFTLAAYDGAVWDNETIKIEISSFNFTVEPLTVQVMAGRTASLSFNVTSLAYPHSYTVNVSAAGVPEALSVSITPPSGTPDFTGSISVWVSSEAYGNYTVTFRASDGVLTRTVIVEVQVSTFNIELEKDLIYIKSNSSGSVGFTVSSVNGYSGTVNVTVYGPTPPLSFTVSPTAGTPTYSGVINVSASLDAEGEFWVIVRASDGVIAKDVQLCVRVPYFKISLEYSVIVTFNGTTASTGVYVAFMYGYNETVSLSAAGVPEYVSWYFEPPSSGNMSFNSRLFLNVSGDARFETSWINVTATSTDGKVKVETVRFATVFLKVAAKKIVVHDEHGYPRVNPDGSYYPGDAFNLTVTVYAYNLEFRRLRFSYKSGVLTGPSESTKANATFPFEVKVTANPGNHTLKVRAIAACILDHSEYTIEKSASVNVEVVEYDPKFTVVVVYLLVKEGGNTTFLKPFAAIVRYEGNGPEHDLGKRAFLWPDYTWEGYALKSGNVTVGDYGNPWLYTVTFTIAAPPEFWEEEFWETMPSDTVLTVDGTPYTVSDLPLTFTWSYGENHTYEWKEKFLSMADPSVEYVFQGCLTGHPRAGNVSATVMSQLVIAAYMPQKPLENFPHGVWPWIRPVVVWTNKPEGPLVFTNASRYAKLKFKVDDEVMVNVEAEGWNEVYVEINFTDVKFSPTPKTVLSINYTYAYAGMIQPVLVRAVKPDGNGDFVIDYDVYVNATFIPLANLTEMEALACWFAEIDETVAEMVGEDMPEPYTQNFTGSGFANGTLQFSTGLTYNITLHVEGYGRTYLVSREVTLPFNETRLYTITVNLVGGGVNVSVLEDGPRYFRLLVSALPESGGVKEVRIYNSEGNLLRVLELPAEGFGFTGNYTSTVLKSKETDTTLTVEVESLWGVTATFTINVMEYQPPLYMVQLGQLAKGLLIFIIAAIIVNIIIYLYKGGRLEKPLFKPAASKPKGV